MQSRGVYTDGDSHVGDNEFARAYCQGLLLEIGNVKGLDTFVPNQDKNKAFAGFSLGDTRSLDAVPAHSYEELVKRSSTIDVIWFNSRRMPCCFFEVEHTADIPDSLPKYRDLQDLYTKMFIVAEWRRREEFDKKLRYEAFSHAVREEPGGISEL